MNSSKKTVSFLLSVGLSGLILWYLGSSLEWKHVGHLLKDTKISYVFVWFIVFFIALIFRAFRWKILFAESAKPTFRHLYDALNIGNLATMILPFRAGELIRPLLFSKWNGVSFGKSFASVVIERIFDVCGMFFIFSFAVRGIPELPEVVLIGTRILSVIAGIIAVAMLVAYAIPKKMILLIDFFSTYAKKILPLRIVDSISSLAKEFIKGLSGIESLIQLLIVVISTVVIWILYVVGFQLLFLALGGSADASGFGDSFAIAAVACVFVSLFIAAPSAPGFLGTFQLGCVAALTGVFAYSEEFSIAFSIIAHSLQFIATIVVGCLSMFLRGLSLSSIQQKTN